MTPVDAVDVIVDLLRRGHAVRFQVRGDSMHPIIREHDFVQVEPRENVRAGDVVLALAGRGLTAHRVIRIDAATFVMRGDNATAADEQLPVSAILGVVVSVERGGKKFGVRWRLPNALRRLLRRWRGR